MLKVLKWELIVRMKRRLLSFPILNRMPLSVVLILSVLFCVFKFAGTYIVYDLIFHSAINIPGNLIGIEDFSINRLSGILIFIFLISLLVDIIGTSHDFIIIKNTTTRFHYYAANTNYTYQNINMIIVTAEILWSMSSVFLVQIPFILVILKNLAFPIWQNILYVLVFIGINILLKYLLGVLLDFLLYKSKKNITSILSVVFVKGILIGLFVEIGRRISPWLSQFPLMKRNVDSNEFFQWIMIPFRHLDDFLSQPAFYNFLSLRNLSLLFLLLSGITLLICRFVQKCEGGLQLSNQIPKEIGEHKISSGWFYYFLFCFRKLRRNKMFIYLLGSNGYWIVFGLACGILSSLQQETKIYYLVIFQYTFWGIFFLMEGLLSKLSDIYLFLNEGKKLFYWNASGYALLLRYKMIILLINLAFPIAISSLFLLSFHLIDVWTLAFTVFFQFSYAVLYFLMKNRVYGSQNKILNLSDIEFKKSIYGSILNDSVGFFFLVIILPIAAIPLAVYMTDVISHSQFISLGFYGHSILILGICLIVYFTILKNWKPVSFSQQRSKQMKPILELQNIYKSYQNKLVLKDISFQVFPGDILAYLGRNGSGKTTTFQIISGLIGADSGDIILNEKSEFNLTNIQFLFDEPVLYDELTLEEHLRFVCEIHHYTPLKNEISKMLQMFEMEEHKNTQIADYSLGMKKKTQLMCSIILRPKLLLMDEYISGLDPISLSVVKRVMIEYAQKGNAVILSTHMLDAAEKFCSHAIIIDNGSIIAQEENLTSIKSRYKTLEEYFIAMAAE